MEQYKYLQHLEIQFSILILEFMHFIYKARIKVWKTWGYKIAVLEIVSTTVAVRLLIHPVFNSLPEEIYCSVRHRNVQI